MLPLEKTALVIIGNRVEIGAGSCVDRGKFSFTTIGDGTKLGGNAGVISDVAPGKTLLGFPADDYRQTLRLWAAQRLIKQMKKK